MKKILALLILQLICLSYTHAQDKTIYYDKNWNETDEQDAAYKRIITDYYASPSAFFVTDYYISGSMQMEGKYLDRKLIKRDGPFIYYYKNGNKKELIHYVDGFRKGEFKEWYEKGQLKTEGVFFDIANDEYAAINEKIITFYDSTGTKQVSEGEGFYYDYAAGTNYSESGFILNGLKEGNWTGYDTLINAQYSEIYKNGILQEGKSTNEAGEIHSYTQLIVPAKLKGGTKRFYKFISKEIKYPKKAEKRGLSGIVYVKFTINKAGFIDEVHTVKGIGSPIDQEAERVVRAFKAQWTVGKRRGRIIDESRIIPVNFQLR